jgi:hypothetical protein
MAIRFPTTSDGLTRAAFLTPAGDWSVSLWWNVTALPTGSQYIPIYVFGDTSLVGSYVGVFLDETGVFIRAWDGSTLHESTHFTYSGPTSYWRFASLGYNSTTHILRLFYFVGQSTFKSSVNLSTFIFSVTDEAVGYDLSAGLKIAGLLVSNFVSFPTSNEAGSADGYCLTPAEMVIYLGTGGIGYSVVGLQTASDLTDIGDPGGHDFTAAGTPVTSTGGPFVLGSEFIEPFAYSYLPAWNRATTVPATARIGCNRTGALACAETEIQRHFDTHYTAGTLKVQFAATGLPEGAGSRVRLDYEPVRNGNGTLLGTRFDFALTFNNDGSIGLDYNTAGSVVTVNSAAGLVALNGTWYGLQLSWAVVGAVQSFEVRLTSGSSSPTTIITASGSAAGLTFPYWNNLYINCSNNGTDTTAFDNLDLIPIAAQWSNPYPVCAAARFTSCTPTPSSLATVLPGPLTADVSFVFCPEHATAFPCAGLATTQASGRTTVAVEAILDPP